jgi:hypothetical protein
VEGQQYADAKSYIMIDITLARPLIPKRPPEELARRYQIKSNQIMCMIVIASVYSMAALVLF